MSVEHLIIVKNQEMVSAQDWSTAIRHQGFELDLEPAFDTLSYGGWVSCRYHDHRTGFDYEYLPLLAGMLEQQEESLVGDRDHIVVLTAYRSFRQGMAAMIASAVLARLTGGLFVEGGEGPFFNGAEAILFARESERELEREGGHRPLRDNRSLSH